MRHSRLLFVLAIATLVAVIAAPAVSSAALLTNEWGQQFAGRAVCIGCHGGTYDATTHGRFAKSGASIVPASGAAGMWPAGLLSGGQQLTFGNVAFELGDGLGPTEWIYWNPAMAAVQKESSGVLVADPATGPFARRRGPRVEPQQSHDMGVW